MEAEPRRKEEAGGSAQTLEVRSPSLSRPPTPSRDPSTQKVTDCRPGQLPPSVDARRTDGNAPRRLRPETQTQTIAEWARLPVGRWRCEGVSRDLGFSSSPSCSLAYATFLFSWTLLNLSDPCLPEQRHSMKYSRRRSAREVWCMYAFRSWCAGARARVDVDRPCCRKAKGEGGNRGWGIDDW